MDHSGMTIEEIKNAMIGKRLQTWHHGKLKYDWGEIVYIEHFKTIGSYRLSINDDRDAHYIDADTVEVLCRDGIAEKMNGWSEQYKLVDSDDH